MSGEDEEPGEPNCPEGWAFLTLHGENARLAARFADLSRLYEELRKIIDGGSESMTHGDAVQEVQSLVKVAGRSEELERQRNIAILVAWLVCESDDYVSDEEKVAIYLERQARTGLSQEASELVARILKTAGLDSGGDEDK
jgi:hypothetical protein